jgi:hypothetical protein
VERVRKGIKGVVAALNLKGGLLVMNCMRNKDDQ